MVTVKREIKVHIIQNANRYQKRYEEHCSQKHAHTTYYSKCINNTSTRVVLANGGDHNVVWISRHDVNDNLERAGPDHPWRADGW